MPKSKAISISTYLSHEVIERRIYHMRDTKVMLDKDLAQLYQVSTKSLLQSVKRNLKRFPNDFMYQLTNKEVMNLRSQIVTSSWGGTRYVPYAFTEQGIAMLSSVLNSDRAIAVNVYIMRTFMKMREIALTHKDLRIRIDQMEKKYDEQFQVVFKAIKMLLDDKPRRTAAINDFENSRSQTVTLNQLITLTERFKFVNVGLVMKKFVVVLTILAVACLGFVGALSVLPHAHGEDFDHSSHSTCPIHQLGNHFFADTSSAFPVLTALFLFVCLIASSKDVWIRNFSSSVFLRAPPQAS